MWRRILYKTHLWLGIISGIVLFVVCLSGIVGVSRRDKSIVWTQSIFRFTS
ncbi:MAG: PepSY domain-containing protein [Planctomycetaceae bacterium]|nr:PepSY domain-containing protein [Planctomycetaceae bacterium]